MKNLDLYEDFIYEAQKSNIKIPTMLQHKIDGYAEKGWKLYSQMEEALKNITDMKTFKTEVERSIACGSNYVDLDNDNHDNIVIMMKEETDDQKKFERVQGEVPYYVEVGKNVQVSYGTVGHTSMKPYSTQEILDFIKLNHK